MDLRGCERPAVNPNKLKLPFLHFECCIVIELSRSLSLDWATVFKVFLAAIFITEPLSVSPFSLSVVSSFLFQLFPSLFLSFFLSLYLSICFVLDKSFFLILGFFSFLYYLYWNFFFNVYRAPEPTYEIIQDPLEGHPEFLVAEIHLPEVVSSCAKYLDPFLYQK